MRYKLTLEYDGTDFCGWQRQEGVPSVQQTLEEALVICMKEHPVLFAAGRTDTGVHAIGQVVHFDLEKQIDPSVLQGSINALVRPKKVCVKSAEIVADDFHARFDAKKRRYIYKIQNTRYPPILNANRVCHYAMPLDEGQMQQAANLLIGRHDFSTFRASECQAKSPVKTMDAITVKRVGDMIEIELVARSFLHHQVRNIAGSLMWVGCGKWTVQDFKDAFEACDRRRGGPTAVPYGLYFMEVGY
ncbi:MAG: tRNA pseudouridine(38-40) synthase TruA [Alphaproteobacteria bacterium]|nr:tRNA pseudouridine(38-40) synthase TruA [Alphaproteobacteria bacterium]